MLKAMDIKLNLKTETWKMTFLSSREMFTSLRVGSGQTVCGDCPSTLGGTVPWAAHARSEISCHVGEHRHRYSHDSALTIQRRYVDSTGVSDTHETRERTSTTIYRTWELYMIQKYQVPTVGLERDQGSGLMLPKRHPPWYEGHLGRVSCLQLA